MVSKACNRCEEHKDLTSFSKSKTGKLGHNGICKECRKVDRKRQYQEHVERVKAEVANTLPKTKNCYLCKEDKDTTDFHKSVSGKYGRQDRCKDCEKIVEANRDKELHKKSQALWYKKNLKRERTKRKDYTQTKVGRAAMKKAREKFRRKSGNRLREAVSSQVRNSLKRRGHSKQGSVFDYLPYSIDGLIKRLESQFAEGMSWDNHGEWHLDHIVAHSNFKYKSLEDPLFIKCWELANLQPLWAADNLSKGTKDFSEWLLWKNS